MHDDAAEGLRVRDLVVELGFVTRADVELALEVQEELHEQGEHAHLLDVLEDLGLIDERQHDQVLLHQDMRLVLAEIPGGRRDHRPERWIVAAVVPAALIPSTLGILAAAAVLALGAVIAAGSPRRWVALGWLAAIGVPGVPPAAAAAAGATGSATGSARSRATALLRAAALTAALAPLPLLPVALTPLHYLVAAAALVAALRRWS
jgi:hypothetical protein